MKFLRVILLTGITAGLQAQQVEFNRDIRPILSDRCFACHAADATAKGIRLRLDREEVAKSDLGGGRHAIVPGEPASSVLLQRIRSTNKAMRMPPAHTGATISDAEAALIEQWIKEGAQWQKHWAFLPPQRARLPIDNVQPIDAFVRSRLMKEHMVPSPRADRYTLIRRASLDLTGLPPTPAEADAFVNDTSSDSYAKLLDRLLASDRYAERMTIRWLDAARYADTNGYQTDADRIMWRWRDWVIESYRRNQPYNEFLTEQIAGDLLPNATLQQKIATGFLRNHRGNSEGGIVPEEYLVEYAADRVETLSTVFLGLTVGCARCHNHKFDPIQQKEYYQLMAFVDNIGEPGRYLKYGNSPPMVAAPTTGQEQKLRALEARSQAAREQLAALQPQLQKARKAWEHTIAPGLRWSLTEDLSADLPAEQVLDGRSTIDAGDRAEFGFQDHFTLTAWVKSDTGDGVILQRMNDIEERPEGYGLHLSKGKLQVHFAVRRLDDAILVQTQQPAITAGEWHHIAVSYDGSRYAAGIRIYVDGKQQKLEVQLDALNQDFRRKGSLMFGGGGGWPDRFQGRMKEFRAYGRDLVSDEVVMLAQPSTPAEIAKIPEAERTPAQKLYLEQAFLNLASPPEAKSAYERVRKTESELAAMRETIPTVMVMDEPAVRPDTHVLLRGVYDKPGEKVDRLSLAALNPWPEGAPHNRLGLARWLTSKQNPLTARVAVNRYWQMLFGVGLVKTAEDFGSQGEWPSHLELLDWLALEYQENGWNTKQLLKTIMLSGTYQQSSRATSQMLEKDPENRLLARGARLRLPAEMLRDQALAASGLLSEKVGGPSVHPYQPAGLWSELGGKDYEPDHGDKLYRRSLYTFWKRTAPPPFMVSFDSALRETCTVREGRTNTPLQALHLLNDVQFLEAARKLAERTLHDGGASTLDRLTYAFRLVAVRAPRPKEIAELQQMLAFAGDRFGTDPAVARQFLAQGESPLDPQLDPVEHAKWMMVASMILNLDAAQTKE
jgi:hypothetical protein